jgi:hypothetical protein
LQDGTYIPIELVGNLNKSVKKLDWRSPLFDAEVTGSDKARIQTKGDQPGMNLTIAYVATNAALAVL